MKSILLNKSGWLYRWMKFTYGKSSNGYYSLRDVTTCNLPWKIMFCLLKNISLTMFYFMVSLGVVSIIYMILNYLIGTWFLIFGYVPAFFDVGSIIGMNCMAVLFAMYYLIAGLIKYANDEIELFPKYITKHFSSREKPFIEKEPSLISSLWTSFKEKTCRKIEFVNENGGL